MNEPFEIEFLGKVPSKKNAYRRQGRGGKRMYMDEALKREIHSLMFQVPGVYRDCKLEHPDLEVEFFFASKRRLRADRDNMTTTLLDVLVKSGVLADDSSGKFNGRLTILPAKVEGGDCDRTVVRIAPRPSLREKYPTTTSATFTRTLLSQPRVHQTLEM